MGERADVIVAGGGVIGTSVAFHLARLGVTDVLLLERSHLAAGSTGKSVGIVEAAYGTDVNVALAKRGYEELSRFPEVTGHSADFHPRTYIETVSDPAHRGHLQNVVERGTRQGLRIRLAEAEEIRELYPELRVDDLAYGVIAPDAGFCDPHSVAMGYADAARAMGVRIQTNEAVERILVEGGEVSGVRTRRGEVRSPVVVNATGPWCNELNRPLGFEIPILIWQRQIFVTTPQAEIPIDRPIFVDITGRFYFRQELDGAFVLGLVEDVAAADLANPETDWDFKTRVAAAAVHRLPKLANASIANGWSGIVTFAPDQLPILGPVREARGFYLANALSGYGVMTSPGVGLALAEMIVQGASRSIDVSDLSYERFREGRTVRSAGLWLTHRQG